MAPHYAFVKNIIKDHGYDQAILKCYKIKEKMHKCIERNEGKLEACNNLRREFESCLHIIDKTIVKKPQAFHDDPSSLYN